ncbi:MAG: R3H domain protein [bacterium ADurb.Bin363]|nr:MAG: R3H domain protein [bacterium ADurb.Bin363]
MENFIIIKAKSEEEALLLARQENNISEEMDLEIIEVTKSKSIMDMMTKKLQYKLLVKESIELKIKNKTDELLKLMNIDIKVKVQKNRDDYYTIELDGPDNGIIIGKKGKTLNSFEYLLNAMIRNYKIEVDVENFKEKREETLKDLANKMAEKVIKTGKAVKLNPMPPKERKVIHEVLNGYEDLETHSEGRDPKRYIVVKKKKPVINNV